MTAAAQANQSALVPTKDRPSNVGETVVAMIPQDIETMYRVATIYYKGGICPQDCKSEEQAFARIMTGAELGVGPLASIQNISNINGRTSVWGDLMLALVENSGLMEDFEETLEGAEGTDGFTAVCRAKRKGRPTQIVNRFSISDAKAAGLWGKQGPWQTSKKRMLKMRARSFTLRDGFPDVLKGVYSREELLGEQMIDVTNSAAPVASAAELNSIYLQPQAPSIEDQAETTIGAEGVAADVDRQHATANASVDASAGVPEEEKSVGAAGSENRDEPKGGPEIAMNRETPYATMTAAELARCCRQSVETLSEYEPEDADGIRTFWRSINGAGLIVALKRKDLKAEVDRVQSFLPTAA